MERSLFRAISMCTYLGSTLYNVICRTYHNIIFVKYEIIPPINPRLLEPILATKNHCGCSDDTLSIAESAMGVVPCNGVHYKGGLGSPFSNGQDQDGLFMHSRMKIPF